MASFDLSLFSWEEVVSRFFKEITVRKPQKSEELNSVIGPDKSNEDMFSHFWSMAEAHHILTPEVCHPSATKSFTEAHRYRMLGDEHLEHGDYNKALMCYNRSVMYAPHPPITLSEKSKPLDKRSDTVKSIVCDKEQRCLGWGEYQALAQGYDARARLLFKMKQYHLCIRDIDLTLDLGCPSACRNCLSQMRVICMDQKETQNPADQYKMAKNPFAYVNPPPPELEEINPKMPSVSSAIDLAFTGDQGRHLVATRDIRPGEILCVEEHYVSSVHDDNMLNFCIVCMKRCAAPLPCSVCTMVGFCSSECREEGMTGCHWQECPVLPMFRVLNFLDHQIQAYKLMMKVGYAALKELVPQLQSEAINQPPETLGFNSEGIYDGSTYRSVFHLVTNKGKRPKDDIMKKCLQAFVVTKLLEKSKRFFITSDGVPFTPSQEDFVRTGSTIIHHLMSFTCNSRAIQQFQITSNILPDSPKHLSIHVGNGVPPTHSLFNHSCNPNCAAFSYGKVSVVRAIRSIPKGSAATVSYLVLYHTHSLQTRMHVLRNNFYFICKCDACENNWPVHDAFFLPGSEIHLKCVKCSQAVNPVTQACSTCCIPYKTRMPVAGSLNLTTYNYSLVRKRIQEAASKYRDCVTKGGISSEEEEKIVITMIELLCKYVVEPHELSMASNTLSIYYIRLSDRAYVADRADMFTGCPVS